MSPFERFFAKFTLPFSCLNRWHRGVHSVPSVYSRARLVGRGGPNGLQQCFSLSRTLRVVDPVHIVTSLFLCKERKGALFPTGWNFGRVTHKGAKKCHLSQKLRLSFGQIFLKITKKGPDMRIKTRSKEALSILSWVLIYDFLKILSVAAYQFFCFLSPFVPLNLS